MNKEQWDKHHKVMAWFYADEDRSVLHNLQGSWNEQSEPSWNIKCDYIPNDEYVEFRKAQAEGKTIQWNNQTYTPHKYEDTKGDLHAYTLCSLRIKPDEPEFKVGDWVREIASGFIIQAYADMVHKNFKLWEPREGDVVVCWDDIDEEKVITKWRGVEMYDNCIPYIGQPFDQMK